MNQQDRRPSVGGGGETAPVIDDKAKALDALAAEMAGAPVPLTPRGIAADILERAERHGWKWTDDKATSDSNLAKAERRLRADLDRGDWAYGVNWARDMRLVLDAAAALAAERDRADRWAAQVAAIEKVLDDNAFDDEDGNGFVPVGPLQDALFGKKMPG